jgi:cytoskeletal protein CcmA (bactofilin family)
MFNNNNRSRDNGPMIPAAPPMQQPGNTAKRGMFSVIGPDIVITGNVTASADLHIDGRVEGDVHCGTLAQGTDSQIFGSVTAETARLAGAIEGAVRVKQLTIERSAKITGDVEYENITIENGGHIDGRLKHMSTVAAAAAAAAAPVHSAPRAVETSVFPGANEQAA